MRIGFEYIYPVPTYPAGTSAALLQGLPWYKAPAVVAVFKDGLKTSLRERQEGRCCFCRRLLYDDYATHLEHFVDHAAHPDHRFEIRNLALACGTCNTKKNGYFKTWSTRYKRLNKLAASTQIPVLKFQLQAGSPFPTAPADFRWVNPYVHSYSDHIELRRGWVFKGRTPQGFRMVRGLRLNDLADVERRALAERLASRGGRLSVIVGAIYELNQHRTRDAVNAIVKVLNRRRQANASPP